MPSLLVLPAEMLQSIIDQVNPDDLVNISVSCKELYGAAERHLDKHREQIIKYSELRYSGCFRHEDDDHPVKILREICLDDHIAFYPKSLKITCCDYPEDIEHPDDDEGLTEEELLIKHLDGEIHQEVFEVFGSAIDEKLSKTLRYNDKNISIWRQKLKGHTRGAVLCLLLLLLPNLEKLHLIHFEFEGEILRAMLELIAGGSQDPDVSLGPVALTKLSKVMVKGPEDEAGRCQILAPLAALPSLRTINAESVLGEATIYPWYIDLDWPYEQHMSGVTVLNLQSSCLSIASFSRLLGGIKGLKSFSYDYYFQGDEHDSSGVPVGSIIGILLEHAKASLESVAFTGLRDWHCYGDGDSCSFKDFEVLGKIRMHAAYYLKDERKYESEHRWCNGGESFDVWYDEIERLVDLLPASVRSIELDGRVDIADMSSLLVALPERKAESVPHLENVSFMDSNILCDEEHTDSAWAHAWQKKWRKVGVSLFL